MNDIFENTETMQENEHPRFYTAESVMRGHPDKLCDLIADSVLDECLKHDPASRVACEVMATHGHIIVAGEITTSAKPDVFNIVRDTLRDVGYDPKAYQIDCYIRAVTDLNEDVLAGMLGGYVESYDNLDQEGRAWISADAIACENAVVCGDAVLTDHAIATATGTIQWAAGSLFYLPEGLLVEAVFVSEGEAVQEGDKIAALRREDVEQKLRSLQAELAQKQTEYARLTKPVAADSYDLEKAQQALQAAYQAAENSAAAWAEKEANAGSERDALQRELNERQEKAAQYAREIAEKQAQRELLQQEESPDEEIISRIEAELTQLTAEETQNREALAEAEARLNEADAALESVQSQREEAARTAAQAAEQAEQARNDARHAYEKSVEAASETAAANAASATVLAEQIREMESSVETLKKLDEQEGVFCAPQTGTVESLQLMQGQTSGQVGGSISDPERGYQIRFALEAEDAVQDTAGVTVTVMQGAKSESVKINSSVSQQDGGVVLSAALTGSDWQVGKAELTIRLSETEYDCCLPVSALHSDNGGDFVYSVEERNTILGLQNIVRKVYVEVVERNNELAALRNYTTGAPVVAATTKSLQEGARVRTAG